MEHKTRLSITHVDYAALTLKQHLSVRKFTLSEDNCWHIVQRLQRQKWLDALLEAHQGDFTVWLQDLLTSKKSIWVYDNVRQALTVAEPQSAGYNVLVINCEKNAIEGEIKASYFMSESSFARFFVGGNRYLVVQPNLAVMPVEGASAVEAHLDEAVAHKPSKQIGGFRKRYQCVLDKLDQCKRLIDEARGLKSVFEKALELNDSDQFTQYFSTLSEQKNGARAGELHSELFDVFPEIVLLLLDLKELLVKIKAPSEYCAAELLYDELVQEQESLDCYFVKELSCLIVFNGQSSAIISRLVKKMLEYFYGDDTSGMGKVAS